MVVVASLEAPEEPKEGGGWWRDDFIDGFLIGHYALCCVCVRNAMERLSKLEVYVWISGVTEDFFNFFILFFLLSSHRIDHMCCYHPAIFVKPPGKLMEWRFLDPQPTVILLF